jgi:hypothetical protein
MTILQLADKYIPASNGKKVLTKEGKTEDIVAEVITAFKDSRQQLLQFAPHLQAASLQQTLYNIWSFWKFNIKYKVDPPGKQYIKEPQSLWATKRGDCKSLSLAVMSTLDNLGIKAAFRFTSYYGNDSFPTHVYVVVKDGDNIIPVDCVWTHFGTEKPFTKNWDYNMTSIYRLSGFDGQPKARQARSLGMRPRRGKRGIMPKRGVLHIPMDNPHITPSVCDALLKKQRLELEQKIHAGINGIGTTYDKAYEMQIAGLHNALSGVMGWPRVSIAGFTEAIHPDNRNEHAISGIGCIHMQREAETVAAIEGFFGKIFKGIGKGIKKIGKAIGKGVKAVGKGIAKVAKGIKNLAQKALTGGARKAIMDQLPQVAPLFLYTFITDPKILAKLPPQVAAKLQKANYYKKLITGKLMMSESNFTGAVRNGIMLKFNSSPEDLLALWIKQTNFQVGFLEMAMGLAGGLLKKILGDVGDNLGTDAETFAPAPEDWGVVPDPAKLDMAMQVQQQAANIQPVSSEQLMNTFSRGGGGGGNTSYDDNSGSDTTGEGFTDSGTGVQRPQTLPPIEIKPEATQSNNSGIFIGIAAAGLLLMTMKKK